MLITASYQIGSGRPGAAELLHRSVDLAARAAEAADHEVWVAASVGPYGAVLADGSEYRGRYGLSVRELADFHRPRIEALLAAGPDVLALETLPDPAEAEALLTVLAETGAPAWLSYTVAAWAGPDPVPPPRGLRPRGRGAAGHRGRRQLLRPGRGPARPRSGGRHHRQAAPGLPQRRIGLGRRYPHLAVPPDPRPLAHRRLAPRGRPPHRRLLPHRPRADRGSGRRKIGRSQGG